MKQSIGDYAYIGLSVYLLTAGISLPICMGLMFTHRRKITPSDTKVQKGYIPPSKIEIKCTDIDDDGEIQTTMSIDNRYNFALKYDENERPVIFEYEVKPAQVVPKNSLEAEVNKE